MNTFSIWDWLFVLGVAALTFFARRKNLYSQSKIKGGNYMYSVTQNITAAMHLGKIDPQLVIDRLEDRHKARLPEVGLDTKKLLAEAKTARVRNRIFSTLFLLPTFWTIVLIFDYRLVEYGAISLEEYIFSYVKPALLITALGFAKTIVVNFYLRKNIVNSNDTPDDLAKHNAIIFGGFSPFAGYGIDLDGWSFTIDTRKPKIDGIIPLDVNQKEFLDHISSTLTENMTGGSIQDKLFVNGLRIRGNKQFLSGIKASPITSIEQSTVENKIGSPEQDVRHYRLLSMPLTHGHMFLTFFYRSSMLGGNLFIESRSFLLPPIKPDLTELIQLPTRRGFSYYSRLFFSKLLLSPIGWLPGLIFMFSMFIKIQSSISWALFGHPEDKLKNRTENYNYGNAFSLREGWASKEYQTYFQMLDKDMATKTFQHIIINSIVDYLDIKGIATDDIKERRTQIFNSGVMVSGGTVNAHQLAVGTGATVKSKLSDAFSSTKEK
jgi:hypothetical protein